LLGCESIPFEIVSYVASDEEGFKIKKQEGLGE
jgi:hypothetical protein